MGELTVRLRAARSRGPKAVAGERRLVAGTTVRNAAGQLTLGHVANARKDRCETSPRTQCPGRSGQTRSSGIGATQQAQWQHPSVPIAPNRRLSNSVSRANPGQSPNNSRLSPTEQLFCALLRSIGLPAHVMTSPFILLNVERKSSSGRADVVRDEWITHFSAGLDRLMPLLSLIARHQKGAVAYECAWQLQPEEAATIWANAPAPIAGRTAHKLVPYRRSPRPEDTGVLMLRFVKRLRELEPMIGLTAACQAALDTVDFTGRSNPAKAAELYADRKPPALGKV